MVNNQIILLKFIQTNKNVNWYIISYKYILSENFIIEFQNKVIGIIYHRTKNYRKILCENSKIRLIGLIYQPDKNYLKNLPRNSNII